MAKGFINKDEDLVIVDGTFKVDESDEDCIYNNLVSVPGQFKNAPYNGASVRNLQNGIYDQTAKRKIQKALELDGYSINNINIKIQ